MKDKWLFSTTPQLKFKVSLAQSEDPALFVKGTQLPVIFLSKGYKLFLSFNHGFQSYGKRQNAPEVIGSALLLIVFTGNI